MPTTTLTIDNEYLSSTTLAIAKDWKDANEVAASFLNEQERHLGRGKPVQTGGTRWVQAIGTGTHSQNTRMQTGFESINLSVAGVLTPAVFTPGHVLRPVLISSEEEEINASPEQIIEIAGARVSQTMADLKRDLVQQIVQGSVVGFEDWNTLNGVDANFGAANGFLEELAVGAQTNTPGGLSKATYAAIEGMNNQRYDVGANFNAAGLTGTNRLQIDVNAHGGSTQKRSWLVSVAYAENYKRVIGAQERYIGDKDLDGGNISLAVGGVKAVVEWFMPVAGTLTTADPISAYLLDFSDIYVCWSKGKHDGYFGMDPWHTVSGEFDVRMTKIRVRGQLKYMKLSSSGILFDAQTF